jgi:ElaA protein
VAYARILKSEDDFEPVVAASSSAARRGEKLGYQLMEKTLEACRKQWPDKALYLGAQAHLQSAILVLRR